MRKHDPRKWLHAVLDLLPVIFIPVFMIYSHRHTINDYQVQYAQNEVVDFNQLNNFSIDQYYDDNNLHVYYSNNKLEVHGTLSTSITDIAVTQFYDFNLTHKYFMSFSQSISPYKFRLRGFPGTFSDDYIYPVNFSYPYWEGLISLRDAPVNEQIDISVYFNIFDLTQMFGSGNEPTIEQFNSWYPNDYYSYTTGRKELLKDVSTVTYNNTDIGSQLLYSIYTPVHDYMNFNNVFNFGQIYDWLQLNIFGGTAPMSVFIVWNIVLYEFLMDLIFLLYALFMFFIDFCTNLIDRFHTKCSGGK